MKMFNKLSRDDALEIVYWYKRYRDGLTQAMAALHALSQTALPERLIPPLNRVIDAFIAVDGANRYMANLIREIKEYFWI